MNDVERVRQFARLRALCEGALELDPEERTAWLRRLAEGDAELFAQVEELLRRANETDDDLDLNGC